MLKNPTKTISRNKELIRISLLNDLEPNGDITCRFSIDPETMAKGKIIAKEDGILACSKLAQEILDECTEILSREIEPRFNFKKSSIQFLYKDGEAFKAGDTIAELEGAAHVLLSAERTVLNFLQRLSGVATYTSKFIEKIKDYPVKLLDTRKTMPGMRELGKQAVIQGGGSNHRYNLSDMVLIKENHLIFAAKENLKDDKLCLETFINKTREKLLSSEISKDTKIECEVEKFEQLEPVVKAAVDVIMLDNFSPEDCKKAISEVKILIEKYGINKNIKIEASGGITLDSIESYAKAGVDLISVGSLTNKPSNIDLSMLLDLS